MLKVNRNFRQKANRQSRYSFQTSKIQIKNCTFSTSVDKFGMFQRIASRFFGLDV